MVDISCGEVQSAAACPSSTRHTPSPRAKTTVGGRNHQEACSASTATPLSNRLAIESQEQTHPGASALGTAGDYLHLLLSLPQARPSIHV